MLSHPRAEPMKLRLATALLFYGCSPATPLTRSSPQLPAGDVAVYTGDVAIDPQSQLLTGHWSIRFVADSAAADSVALFLNRGLAVSRVFGPNVSGFASQLSDGDQVLNVRFASRLAPGAEGRIDLEYSGVPTFGSDGINRISPTWVELGLDSYWLPVFADYRKRIAGQVRIDLPPGWSAVASGTITRDGNQLVLTPGIPLIDIA